MTKNIFNAIVITYMLIAIAVSCYCNIIKGFRIFDLPMQFREEVYTASGLLWNHITTDFALLCLIPTLLVGVYIIFFVKD
jgi:hypothetical protein